MAFIGVLTTAEMATYSARPERMRQAQAAGDRRGTLVLVYQRSPSSFLASLQVITTFATLGVGALVNSNLSDPIFATFDKFTALGKWREEAAFATAFILATVITLIFTNVLPKQIGFVKANEVALAAARPMRLWIRLMRPLSWVVAQASAILFRVFRIRPDERYRVTEADLVHLLREGRRAGSLDASEAAMVHRVLGLSDLNVTDIMTKRSLIDWVDLNWKADQIERYLCNVPHSFVPVGNGDLDQVTGVLSVRNWLRETRPAMDKMRLMPVVEVNEDSSLLEMLSALGPIETKMVFVRSKSGDIVGMVTLNDAIQGITGPLKAA